MIRLKVYTVTGDLFVGRWLNEEEWSEDDMESLKEMLKHMKELSHLRIELPPAECKEEMYFNPAHIISVTIETGD